MIACRKACVWSNHSALQLHLLQYPNFCAKPVLFVDTQQKGGAFGSPRRFVGNARQKALRSSHMRMELIWRGKQHQPVFNQTNCRCNNIICQLNRFHFPPNRTAKIAHHQTQPWRFKKMETGKDVFELLLLVADSSLSAFERCFPRSRLYRENNSSYHLVLSSRVKGFLKGRWDIFMFCEKWTLYNYRWSVSRACWLTYWSEKVGLASFLFFSVHVHWVRKRMDRLSRYRTLD